MTFGLYAAEELTAADGKTIPADSLIEVISLDESGHGKAISDLPMGSYYVQEISTNSAYIVSDAKYPVIFEYAGQDTETVRITANEGEAITNDIIYGSVSGKKSDADGKALGGEVIGIFKTGTTEFTKEKAIAAMTMDDILSMQGITVADITLINDLQKSIKSNKVISFLGGGAE
ncbi:SpaA isopeptide-forming pilin-related protein [Enterococcus cecorum]|uniref:SpaA isopeptide-forming pilin-related protein n=1 Tax=Enterococcus cecorum TaxID=44008 RepID=UPI003F8EC17A